MATPQVLEMNWDPDTSVGSIDIAKIRGLYRQNAVVRDVLVWTGQATTASTGAFSVNLTSDGTATGPSLFSDIYSVSATHILNTTTIGNACFAMLRGYTTGMKSAAFLSIKDGVLGAVAGGTGLVFLVTVIGSPA